MNIQNSITEGKSISDTRPCGSVPTVYFCYLFDLFPGIRAPRNIAPPGRSFKEKHEPFGPESAEFSTRRYMQRDVEIEIEGTDKVGGFIGSLYLNKTENAAIELVREGLATVHAYSAEGLSCSKQLIEVEERKLFDLLSPP
jgi:endonuclease YncB( thermonuclease family)